MIFLALNILQIVTGLSCSETVYQNLVLEPTRPYYTQQFTMNQADFKGYYDALGFGFWSQFRPYQEILEIHEIDNSFQLSQTINGALIFSIRNVNTNIFETAYYLGYPFYNDYISHVLSQQSSQSPSTYTRKIRTELYEGAWIYTHIQFVPWRQLMYIYLVDKSGSSMNTLPFKVNQYGKKEILISGRAMLLNQNLEQFYGRMTKPLQIQIEYPLDNYNRFMSHYYSCNAPKSCQQQIYIDIQKDLLYLDSKMYIFKTIEMYENSYAFGGWVKLDFTNIHERTDILLLRATINKDYQNENNLGDRSFNIIYRIDLFSNRSEILVQTYSYNTPQKGLISDYGKTGKLFLHDDDATIVQDNLQKWHYIQFIYGYIYQNKRTEAAIIQFPELKKYYYTYFFNDILQSNQFTTEYMYLHIGVDKYQIQYQFQGWIQDFKLLTCIQSSFFNIPPTCHFSCKVTFYCTPTKCEQCPDDSHRIFLSVTKQCECAEGYYSVYGQPICQRFQDNFKHLKFQSASLAKEEQCEFGQYQYKKQCYQCPLNIKNTKQISCLECINNKFTWYLNPICQTDYVKLIGSSNEPFYLKIRQINEIDLYLINSISLLELCDGCYSYCDILSFQCFLSSYYHVGKQMIVQCKQNYYFNQSNCQNIKPLALQICNQCMKNCEICDSEGQCIQCEKQHYFDPYQNQCLQCDIRCDECQYDKQMNEQVCTTCPQYFTLYNRSCLKCGIYCKFCLPAFYKSTGQVYAKCYQCLDHKKNFISFDGINCHVNMIQNCLYQFQYYESDRHVQTIDMDFEPRSLNSTIITACAKCKMAYQYIISQRICIDYSAVQYMEYSVKDGDLPIVCLSAGLSQVGNLELIQQIGGYQDIRNCDGAIYSKTEKITKCSWCNIGYYVQRLRGNCIECPPQLNCLVCHEQQKINKDFFKYEFKAFYEWFVNFDGKHNFEDYAQSQNQEDFEVICTVCPSGYQQLEGRCVRDCSDNCAECIYLNEEFQCLRCDETIQGIKLTLVNNQCIQCPFNCAVCQPQDDLTIYSYNPYFNNNNYAHYTHLCLQPMRELQTQNLFLDPEIGNYINCDGLLQCRQEMHFQIIVHCDDSNFDQLLQQSPNQIEFKQQNIKLSQLFSQSSNQYQNDVVYMRLNQKSVKLVNETFLFTNASECVISQASLLQSQFNKNVYSIKETQINLIAIDDNVKIYFSSTLQFEGFSYVNFQNLNLISLTLNPLNFIIISHLINTNIKLQNIQLYSLSQDSTISFTILNSSNISINNFQATKLYFVSTNLFNIQYPKWNFEGKVNNLVMNVFISNFSVLDCTFQNSSLLNSQLDNLYIYNFYDFEIQAKFINSPLFSEPEIFDFSNKIISLNNIHIQSQIIDTSGFIHFSYINTIRINGLTYENSQFSNSILIKSNSQFSFDQLNFINLKIIGNSTLLKYEASLLGMANEIQISRLMISETSYEEIYPFLYLVDQAPQSSLKLSLVSLNGNYLSQQLQNSNLKSLYYYSAQIYFEMQQIQATDINVIRMPGYFEFSFVNTINLRINTLNISQLEKIKGLHQYLDCQQNQKYGKYYFSVISIYKAKYTLLNDVNAQKLTLYNYPLIQYQSIDSFENLQSESINIFNSHFISNMILVTKDIKSSSLIVINSNQQIEINMQELQFEGNQLNTYSTSNDIHSCLINIQCFNGTATLTYLEAQNNLVTNSTFVLFYINIKSLTLSNSIFQSNNIFDYQKIKPNLMWSLPLDAQQISLESLQSIFPIKSDGILLISFETLQIVNVTIESAQGCKGGGIQLYMKENGIINITNTQFVNISASSNCDQSFGGAVYLDATKSKLLVYLTKIYVENVMSLNEGGFLYLKSSTNELQIVISQIQANNIQSQKGSFIFAQLLQSQTIIQRIDISNCSFENTHNNFIQYLGFLSTFINLDKSNILVDRTLIYIINGYIFMRNIVINQIDYESFIYASNCIQIKFNQLYFGGGNYSGASIIDIHFQPQLVQKLMFENVHLQNFRFQQHTPVEYMEKYQITLLTFLCQQNMNFLMPDNLEKVLTIELLNKRGQFYLYQYQTNIDWQQYTLLKISKIDQQDLTKMNDIRFENIDCSTCQSGLMYLNFESGKKNIVQLNDLLIFNSSCGTLGCILISSGEVVQSDLQLRNQIKAILQYNRLLTTLEQDYYSMNYSFKIYNYQCFYNQGVYGICLFINNVELQIINSQFSHNIAVRSGGAIYSTNSKEQLSLIQTVFENNSATLGNNLIYQMQLLPNLTKTKSISYQQNPSDYNYNIATPQKLKITKYNHKYFVQNKELINNSTLQIDMSLLDSTFYFPNGQSLSSYQYFDLQTEKYIYPQLSLRLVALDMFDQEQVKIEGTSCNIYGRKVLTLEDKAEFTQNYTNLRSIEFNSSSKDYNLDNLILYFDYNLDDPENTYFQLQFTCDSIKVPIYTENDEYNIQSWHDQYYLRTSLIKPLRCQIGEIMDSVSRICTLCDSSAGFYSVKFNSNKCETKNDLTMISVNSAQINLKQFYWRPYVNANIVENCFNLLKNCLGGQKQGDKSCFVGHIGALCEQCDLYNIRGEGQFSISGAYTCGSCQSINQNALIICLVSIFTLLSIIISVKSADDLVTDLSCWARHMSTGILVANQRALAGILIKMLTNYLQIAGSLNTFKLQIPNWINSVIIVSSDPIQSMAYSLDCFLIDMFKVPILYGRIIWHLIMPLIYIFVAIIIFYFIKRKSNENFRFGIISTILIYTIIYLQPNIIKSLISSISYRNISGYKWVQGHVAYRYDSDQHQEWLLFLILLIVAIGILIPLYFFYKLFNIKDRLNQIENRSTWGFLYNEYSKWAYYWEIVKILLKEIIIIILTYYEDSILIKAILVNLSITFYSHYLLKWKPYNLSFLNKLESQSSRTCSISMIIGLGIYASQQQNIIEVQNPFFLVLFILNINFLIKIISKIGFAYLDKFQIQIDKLKAQINQRFPHLKSKIPQCSRFLESKTQRKQLIKFAFKRLVNSVIIQQKEIRKVIQSDKEKVKLEIKSE